MSAAAKQELESQGTFFSPPPANREHKASTHTAEDASSPAKLIESPIDPNLTMDQAEALRRIEAACEPGESYLLTGHAGSGKTYLMQRLTLNMKAKNRRVILTAPWYVGQELECGYSFFTNGLSGHGLAGPSRS